MSTVKPERFVLCFVALGLSTRDAGSTRVKDQGPRKCPEVRDPKTLCHCNVILRKRNIQAEIV
jgi:hypothetical protein